MKKRKGNEKGKMATRNPKCYRFALQIMSIKDVFITLWTKRRICLVFALIFLSFRFER